MQTVYDRKDRKGNNNLLLCAKSKNKNNHLPENITTHFSFSKYDNDDSILTEYNVVKRTNHRTESFEENQSQKRYF